MSVKTAVVTGANRGLGFELVKQLAEKDFTTVFALCRGTSDQLTTLQSEKPSKITVVEDIDVSNDQVVEKLKAYFAMGDDLIPIHLLIHNAGAMGPPMPGLDFPAQAATQTLANVAMDTMRSCFEINTLGPLRVTQALLPNLEKAENAKNMIITSLVGSITDNSSGGLYAYRTSKAAVNMIGQCMAQDLKSKNIVVGLIHPGMVFTGFARSGENTERWPGQRDVEPSAKGVLDAIDAITMENTGAFLHGNYGEGVKPCPW
jgi:tubulin alpha